MKCGTNKLAELLLRNPRIKVNACSLANTQGGRNEGLFQAALKQGLIFEGHDFTHNHRNDPDGWMNKIGKRLPLTIGNSTTTFDKSLSYMDIQLFSVAKIAIEHLPNAKIVSTLCNPVERHYSELHHLIRLIPDSFNKFYRDNDISTDRFCFFCRFVKT